MGDKDKQILELAELSQARTAKALDVSAQAVNVGVNSSRSYLNAERLRKVFRSLWNEDPVQAGLLRRSVETVLPNQVMTLYETGREIAENDPSRQDFREMWVIAREPDELTEIGYLGEMTEHHLLDETKTIEYYVPPGETAERLAKAVTRSLSDAEASATVRIFSLPNIQAFPHYTIFEPGDAGDFYGVVKTYAYEFVRLPPQDVKLMIIALSELKQDGVARLWFDTNTAGVKEKK